MNAQRIILGFIVVGAMLWGLLSWLRPTPTPVPKAELAVPPQAQKMKSLSVKMLEPRADIERPLEAPILKPVQKERSAVYGSISVAGQPTEGNLSLKNFGNTLSKKLGANGTFRFENISHGTWTVQADVVSPIGRRIYRDTIEVKGDTEFVHDFGDVGSVKGTVIGMKPGESCWVFALHGEHTLAHVTAEDLDDFGADAEAEVGLKEDGSFVLKDLEPGHYTIVALSMEILPDGKREFFYAQAGADVQPGGESTVSLSLEET